MLMVKATEDEKFLSFQINNVKSMNVKLCIKIPFPPGNYHNRKRSQIRKKNDSLSSLLIYMNFKTTCVHIISDF